MEDFKMIYKKDNDIVYADYMICNHCEQRVERGIINASSHWINCTERLKKLNIMEGKCPVDGRKRPVFITLNNKRILAMADGEGNAYEVYGEGYAVFESECKPENRYNPKKYEFERGLTGFDF